MSKPPGVRMTANESQNPPYEESAVAPKVFPTAISLRNNRQRCCSKCWLRIRRMKNIPHASKQLHQASVSKGQTDHQIGRTQPPRPHVDQAQDEGGQGESAQAQRRRIGNATVFDLLVETGLEFSSKGRQALFTTGSVDMGKRTVAEASSSFGGLVLLVGHFTVHTAVAVGFFVVAIGAVAGEFGVGVGGHCDGEEIFKRPRAVEVEVRCVGGRNCLVSRETTADWGGGGG